ncbi:acyltransferase family protein [Dyella sedimenti]|uniref:acyltransferase family protein n=1 Tax=Dyella sedimenti TaxID=2919947 RepID=UPI001FAAD32F|nr:acyltransferase family protein [Dyella sedimenti]
MKTVDYRLGYRGDIEGLRALAILLVIAAHAGVPWLAGGFVGVDIFFVLSGFLITGLLVREIASTGRLAFGAFYLRRLRRLLPALVCMLAVVSWAGAMVLAPGEQMEQARTATMAALWLSNIHFSLAHLDYFAAGADSNLFLHTWSLGVEEQFYLVWPALLFWAAGRQESTSSAGRLKMALLIVAILSLFGCLWLTPSLPQFAFYMMPMRAWQFAAGGLIWLYGESKAQSLNDQILPVNSTIRVWSGWLGLAAILGAGITFNTSMSYPGWRALLPTLGTAAMVWAGFGGQPAGVASLLSSRPLQAIGKVSYSWYLWHWPALLLAYATTGSHGPWIRASAVLASLGLAVLSYRFVESPIRHQGYWLKHGRAALAGGVAAMFVVSMLMMHWYTRALVEAQSPQLQRYVKARTDAPVIYSMGCDDWYRSDRVAMCMFGQKNAKHTAVLMGDSTAGQWSPTLAEIFMRPDWRLIVLTKSSCPMVDVEFFDSRLGRNFTECTSWRTNAIEQIASLKPDIVVLGSVATSGFTRDQWIDGTAKVLTRLSPAVGRIYMLRGTPHLSFDGPSCLAANESRPIWLRTPQACAMSSREEHAQHVFDWLSETAARFVNVQMIDMNDAICPDGLCNAELHGHIIFRDSQHLTASFAQSLAPELMKRMNVPDLTDLPASNETTLRGN